MTGHLVEIGLQMVRAAFTPSASPFSLDKSADPLEEDKLNEDISAPEVRELIGRLRALNKQHVGVVAELRAAEAEMHQAEADLAGLKARVAEREAELASSGEPVPLEPFEEETQAAQVDRKRRVCLARVGFCEKRVSASQAEIDELKSKLESAWFEFGKESYHQTLVQYREAMIVARNLYAALMPWKTAFYGANLVDFPSPGYVASEDPFARNIQERDLLCSNLMTDQKIWLPIAGTLHAAIRALRSEIEQAKTGGTE
jgi:hypothetical protein